MWSAIAYRVFYRHHPLWEKERQSGSLIPGLGQVFKEWPCTWLLVWTLLNCVMIILANFCLLAFSSWRAEARKWVITFPVWWKSCTGVGMRRFHQPSRSFLPSQSVVPSSPALTRRGKLQGPGRRGAVARVRSVAWKPGRRAAACCWIWFVPVALKYAGTLKSKNTWFLLFFLLGPWETKW